MAGESIPELLAGGEHNRDEILRLAGDTIVTTAALRAAVNEQVTAEKVFMAATEAKRDAEQAATVAVNALLDFIAKLSHPATP